MQGAPGEVVLGMYSLTYIYRDPDLFGKVRMSHRMVTPSLGMRVLTCHVTAVTVPSDGVTQKALDTSGDRLYCRSCGRFPRRTLTTAYLRFPFARLAVRVAGRWMGAIPRVELAFASCAARQIAPGRFPGCAAIPYDAREGGSSPVKVSDNLRRGRRAL